MPVEHVNGLCEREFFCVNAFCEKKLILKCFEPTDKSISRQAHQNVGKPLRDVC